jgi:hypothetical protein
VTIDSNKTDDSIGDDNHTIHTPQDSPIKKSSAIRYITASLIIGGIGLLIVKSFKAKKLRSLDKNALTLEVSFSAKNDTEGCIRKKPSLYE